jgi:hypothetical protein
MCPLPAENTSGKLIRNPSPTTGLWPSENRATCASGPRRRFGARLQDGNFDVLVGAVVCGPHYAQGEHALQRMVRNADFNK